MCLEHTMKRICQKLIQLALLTSVCVLSACGGGSDSNTNVENGQLADPSSNEQNEPLPPAGEPIVEPQDPGVTPSEPPPTEEPAPSSVSSIPPHLRDANIALRDSLSADIEALLPEDCLLEVGGAIYCYSVSTRTLMAVLRSPASIYWQFPLPGNEDGNRIEALKILDTFSLGIIANTTTETGKPQYELSRFDLNGAFCCTFNIAEPLASLKGSSDAPYPAINVDKAYVVAASEDDQLAIAGTYSELTPNADPGNLADWVAKGSVLTSLNTDNGSRKATRLFKNETIVELEYASRSTLDVTTDVTRYRLNSETLGDQRMAPVPNTGSAISEETIAVLLPVLYNHLHGNVIESLGVEVESVSSTFDSNLDDELPACARSSDTSGCIYDITATPVTMACRFGGNVTVAESESRAFIPGSGSNVQTSRDFAFNDCVLSSPERDLHSSVQVTLDGNVAISTFEGGIRQGNSSRKTIRFENYRVNYIDKNLQPRQESVTATLTLNDIVTGQLDKRRELEASRYEFAEIIYPRNQPTPLVTPRLSLSNMTFSKSTVLGDGVNVTSVVARGSLDAVGELTKEQNLSMLIDPPLFRPYISTTTGLSGGISLTASDGSAVMINARNVPSGLGEELELTFGSGVPLVRPFESLVRPWIDRD